MSVTSSQQFARQLVRVFPDRSLTALAYMALNILEPRFSDQLAHAYLHWDEPVNISDHPDLIDNRPPRITFDDIFGKARR
jgi:hypothetical protein